ncbi:MAG: hypothetical protein RLZZ352_104 [Pseudomonadota bacterium]|jgi:uncharacterized protein YuzE
MVPERFHLADRTSVNSDEMQDGVVLDFDAHGALVGIDLQHTSQRADINNLSVSKLPLGQQALQTELIQPTPKVQSAKPA